LAPTITRLVLSLALMVAAPVFYTIIFVTWLEATSHRDDEVALLVADVVVGLGFALGWMAIWFFEVRWTALRATLTVVVFGGSVLASVVTGLILAAVMREEELGILFGGMLFAVFWLTGTGLAWIELPGERRRRLASVGMSEVVCPKCGYNMRGRKQTACPECGSAFTLDALFAAQIEQRGALGGGALGGGG